MQEHAWDLLLRAERTRYFARLSRSLRDLLRHVSIEVHRFAAPLFPAHMLVGMTWLTRRALSGGARRKCTNSITMCILLA